MRFPWRKKPQPGLFSAAPVEEGLRLTEQVRPRWLWFAGVVGIVLVGLAIALDLVWNVKNILPTASLEVGVGMVLFAVLFLLQRRIVRATTLVWMSRLEVMASQTGQDPEELRRHVEGPVALVNDFVAALLNDDGDYEQAWQLADANWRLCRAQAWLWNNRHHPDLAGFNLDQAAAGLAESRSTHELWDAFAQAELAQFRGVYGNPDLRTWGAASRPRRVDDGEIVLLLDLSEHPNGAIVYADTPVIGVSFLVREINGEWKIANVAGDHLPQAGWPPDWRVGFTYFDRFLDNMG